MNAIHRNSERGQTLIETLVAVFILVMGISTAIGLGTYAFKSADDSTRVIVGTSLAREGIEAVKNQRDSNWVAESFLIVDTGQECTFDGGTTQQPCSLQWLANLGNGTYALDFIAQNAGIVFTPTQTSFALRYCPGSSGNPGTYISSTSGAPACANAQTTVYSRKIVLQSSSSYNGTEYNYTDSDNDVKDGFLSAIVTVWWTSRSCPLTTDPSTLPSSCKTTLELHLTNWQNKFIEG